MNGRGPDRVTWQPGGRGQWQPRGQGGRGEGSSGAGSSWQSRGKGRGSYPGRRNWYNKFRGQGSTRGTVPSPQYRTSTPSSQSQNNQIQIVDMFKTVPSPYQGWKLYFPQESYKEESPTVTKVKIMENFILQNSILYSHTTIEERRAFSVDLKLIKSDAEFMKEWPTFEEDLSENPEHTINCLGLAMHQIVFTALQNEVREQLQEEAEMPPLVLPIIRARIANFEPVIQLKNLKAMFYGKLVAVRGTIIRVGNIKLLCIWMAFECNTCHAMQCVKQPEGYFTQPTKCITDSCRSKCFTQLHSSPFTQTINWQSVRLQEIVADDQREGGRVPRTVECELTEDLLDSCVPGDVVTITGIVKVRNSEEYTKKKTASMFLMYLDAVSVVNNKNQSLAGCTKSMGVEFNMKDYYAIQEIHSQPDLFRFLVNSVCPTIYGHEMVKAGLLLALFGGTLNHVDGRSDPHVLVVGDPGLGKSQMLQACASIAPRGVYVCGNTSTATGLTVTLTREAGGNYALEAGALVLADQGCCCIDEFDKMSNQHQALLEAMEQQSISIAKAGVVCSLPARTSILAAANPVGGHYNRAKTVSENLRMGSALLSRFDLVFILLDQPNEQWDSLLSEHVMALHSGIKGKGETHPPLSETSSVTDGFESERPLNEKLKLRAGEVIDFLPHQLFRKYIMYARKYVQSRLTPSAAQVLQKFYLELRKFHKSSDCTPITTRQLESLIRLTEARAKLELREEATDKDAQEVVEIMKYSMVDTLSDGFGGLDFNRSLNGSGMSSRNQGKRFISALQRRAEVQTRSVFSVDELKEVARQANIDVTDFVGFLSALNNQGYLLKKASKLYQLLTVDY
ncbi:hypothetical protein L9F63_004356 [Diploptera punctata]|uniref:DNA helicase MCM8 n=1 Tax=Diploptera punctata TaxID=6984 RepID=A0AAD8E7G1_DIPPU|nr:hypothetical protein L9F63_004356 [Diploptera punctata]